METVLGRWIAVLRLDCGLTRGTLAARLGVPASTVARWECESESVPAEVLEALAEALQVPLNDLLALHAQANRRVRIPRAMASRKRPLKYPVAGTVSEMTRVYRKLGRALSKQVQEKFPGRRYHELLEQFPRDSALQLLFSHHMLAHGADQRKVRLLDLGCGLFVTQRTRKLYDGDRERHALILPGDDWVLVLVPQVPIAVPTCPQIYRADFLGLYADSYGHRHWLDITVEDVPTEPQQHMNCPSALGMPRFRFTTDHLRRENFVPLMIADLRRYMMSDVVHDGGVTTIRVRQPARLDAPSLTPRAAEPTRSVERQTERPQ